MELSRFTPVSVKKNENGNTQERLKLPYANEKRV